MKKKLILYSILILLSITFIPLISSVTLSDTNITSTGLNSTIIINQFSLSFDKLDVFSNAITFYNLSYIHPNSCKSKVTLYSVYNYTTANQNIQSPSLLNYESCGGGGLIQTCYPLWICEKWSLCSNNIRKRSCVDIKYCNSEEKPSLLLSCSETIPSERIIGCVDFMALDGIIIRWKLDILRIDTLNEGIYKWKNNIDC